MVTDSTLEQAHDPHYSATLTELLQGRSVAEIANSLGLSTAAVKGYRREAIRRTPLADMHFLGILGFRGASEVELTALSGVRKPSGS